jgi:hypothetical protein
LVISHGGRSNAAIECTTRGPFEHNGSVATLEDWFDRKRLNSEYLPTGCKGYGMQTRAMKGHDWGLNLSPDEKRALILRTL